MTLTVGSLFSGIGGLELGFERAGFKVAWQVELDAWCRQVLTKHWPDVPKFEDVREVGAHNLAPVDVIVGGFPCQDISNAGKRVGITGERSGLWSEYARIVRALRPRYVVVENVSALLHRGLDVVLGDLAQSGYDAEWQSLPAAAFGAPHRRDRLFLVAYTQCWGVERQRGFGELAGPARRNQSAGEKRQWVRDTAGCSSQIVAHTPGEGFPHGGRAPMGESAAKQEPQRCSSECGGPPHDGHPDSIASEQNYTQAITEPPKRNTRLGSPRLFGGRVTGVDWWAVEPPVGRVANGIPRRVDRLKGLGNAVVPQVAEYVARCVLAHATNQQ